MKQQPLSTSSLETLWHRFHVNGDQKAREAIIDTHAYLARITAGRFATRKANVSTMLDFEDLVGAAFAGLVKAVDQFDPRNGARFITYAICLMRGAVLEHIRNTDWAPRTLRDQIRAGKVEEIHCVSLEALVSNQHADSELRLADTIQDPGPSPDQQAENSVSTARLFHHIHRLPEQQRLVIQLYYGNEMTYKQIAERFRISESRAYQLCQQGLKRLRASLAD